LLTIAPEPLRLAPFSAPAIYLPDVFPSFLTCLTLLPGSNLTLLPDRNRLAPTTASGKLAATCSVASAKPKPGFHPALPSPSSQSPSNRSLKHSAPSATATLQPRNFRCVVAGPFPLETLGWVPRQNRPCDRPLLWPNCGLHLVLPKSAPRETALRNSGSSDSGHHTLALIGMYSSEFNPQWKKHLILCEICAETLLPVEICGNQVKNCKSHTKVIWTPAGDCLLYLFCAQLLVQCLFR
jgi:hypothetical protein